MKFHIFYTDYCKSIYSAISFNLFLFWSWISEWAVETVLDFFLFSPSLWRTNWNIILPPLEIKFWNLEVWGKPSHYLHGKCSLAEEPTQLSAQIEIVSVSPMKDTGFWSIESILWCWYGYVTQTDPGAHGKLTPKTRIGLSSNIFLIIK